MQTCVAELEDLSEGRALRARAWRARAWALVETALYCACATLVCLVHYDSGYIGPVARPYREQCRGRVRAYARNERYAYMVEPALAMCDGALRDALPVVWAQMGEALMFCAMAAALQRCGVTVGRALVRQPAARAVGLPNGALH